MLEAVPVDGLRGHGTHPLEIACALVVGPVEPNTHHALCLAGRSEFAPVTTAMTLWLAAWLLHRFHPHWLVLRRRVGGCCCLLPRGGWSSGRTDHPC